MRRDFQRRLAKLEARSNGGPPPGFEVWIDDGSGLLCSGEGDTMTKEAYDAAYPDSIPVTVSMGDKRLPRHQKSTAERCRDKKTA